MSKSIILSMKYEKNKLNTIDKAYHLCMALLPVLIIYNVPVINLSLGTVLLLLFLPHALWYTFSNLRKKKRINFLPLFIFYIYLCMRADGDVNTYILNGTTIIHFGAVLSGALRGTYMRRIIEKFALFNTVLVLIQTVLYYVVRINLSFIAYSMLQRDFALTYASAGNLASLYRPTAMFLEPAFFSQYCLFAIICLLFPKEGKADVKRAGLIAMGIVATTSGMGILLTAFVFGWYVLINRKKLGTKIVSVVKWTMLALTVLLILSFIPFFQQAMMRVFSNLEGYNALTGRTGHWENALDGMTGADLWFGYGRSASFPFYLSGVPYTVFHYGLIGIGLEAFFIIYLMIKKRNNFVWCSCIAFVVLLCIAQLTSVYLQLFYFGLLITDAMIVEPRRQYRAYHSRMLHIRTSCQTGG